MVINMYEIYHCPKCGKTLDKLAIEDLFASPKIDNFSKHHNGVLNYLLANGGATVHWFMLFNEFSCECGWETTASHITRCVYDTDVTIEKDYVKLLHIYDTWHDINGLYKGEMIKNILNSFFARWNYLSDIILCCAPFISSETTYGEWEWLTENLMPYKFFIITRPQSKEFIKRLLPFKMLSGEIDFDDSEILEIIFDLDKFSQKIISPVWAEDNIKTVPYFHAKFYAGIFQDHVEIIHSSYNPYYHENRQLENAVISILPKNDFIQRFVLPFNLDELRVPSDSILEQSTEVGVGLIFEHRNELDSRRWRYKNRLWEILLRYDTEILNKNSYIE